MSHTAVRLDTVRLERMDPTEADWRRLDGLPDRTLFQTREWVEFVSNTQGGEPVVAEVVRGGEVVGYFTGLVVRKYGLRILGSPFPGWTTPSMGFTLTGDVTRREAAAALTDFAFRTLRCVHVELTDQDIQDDALTGHGFGCAFADTVELPLGSDEEMFAGFTAARRNAIRKGRKVGVVVEEATDLEFADDYHAQLQGVFARQGLVPTYDVGRVRELITRLAPTGRLLLLRARAPEGHCIATAIFPAFGRTAYFWGGASVREYQILRPNEALVWHALRHWRDRGATVLDFGGGRDYKRQYGGRVVSVPSFRRSRVAGLGAMRDVAQRLVGRRQRWQGRRLARGHRP
ncbi:GNAT family N-acetyltransferase [Pseudonocardia acaciae]|uniref:GNAT family N-acetyltransferase n=1 Tax=Pseudonocardia acaciae TaxID=551276 RepID=UPI0006859249|nr:GNAT family N-acetyltransferase [Pseudonocardia acaciae]